MSTEGTNWEYRQVFAGSEFSSGRITSRQGGLQSSRQTRKTASVSKSQTDDHFDQPRLLSSSSHNITPRTRGSRRRRAATVSGNSILTPSKKSCSAIRLESRLKELTSQTLGTRSLAPPAIEAQGQRSKQSLRAAGLFNAADTSCAAAAAALLHLGNKFEKVHRVPARQQPSVPLTHLGLGHPPPAGLSTGQKMAKIIAPPKLAAAQNWLALSVCRLLAATPKSDVEQLDLYSFVRKFRKIEEVLKSLRRSCVWLRGWGRLRWLLSTKSAE